MGLGRDLETKTGLAICQHCFQGCDLLVKMPECQHYLCLKCFRLVHYWHLPPGFWSSDPRPETIFPEPVVVEVEAEVPKEPEYPEEEDEDDEFEDEFYDEELTKARCPFCRKRTIPPWRRPQLLEAQRRTERTHSFLQKFTES